MDLLVLGGVGIDTIVRVPSLPLAVTETIHVEPVESYVGHTGHGVALGAHRLGLRTTFADVIGDDAEGRRIRATYDELGLPFHPVVHPSGTRRAVNLVSPDGRRLSLYDGRHPADLRVDPSLWRQHLDGLRHAHVSIMDFARHALPDLIDADCTISTDLHDWDGHNPYHQDFAYAADLVFLSTSALTEAVPAERIFANGRAQLVIATSGAAGSTVFTRDGQSHHVDAVTLPNRPVVDSNGAGDAYVAAFLSTWLNGTAPLDAAKTASIAGAWACGSAGTHTDLITKDLLLSAASGHI